jgi:prepilin-type N-terminal cleavage/methylation domain-containing protein
MGFQPHIRQCRRAGTFGFTLVELVMVMAIVAILLSVVMKSTSGMMVEGNLSKIEGELSTIKAAVTSYWKNNSSVYPADIHASLVAASPLLMPNKLTDPFTTDQTNQTYGYFTGSDSTFGTYFVIYSRGPRADTTPTWEASNQRVTYSGSGRCDSNAPVIKN